MNYRNPARRLTVLVVGPLVAGGLILGVVVVGSPASAGAQPAVGGGWDCEP